MSTSRSGSMGKADFARGFYLAFEFVGAVFLFWLVGRLLDGWLGTDPWIQVVGAIVGWLGGFLHVYYRTKGEGWQDVVGKTTNGHPVEKEDAQKESRGRTGSRAGAGASETSNGARHQAKGGTALGGRR